MNSPRNYGARTEAKRWLDHSENVRKVYYAVWFSCTLVLGLEFLIDKHVETGVEQWFGFHGFFGLAACVTLVVAAKLLRRIIARPEEYYDDR